MMQREYCLCSECLPEVGHHRAQALKALREARAMKEETNITDVGWATLKRDYATQLTAAQQLRLEVFRAFVHRPEISDDDVEAAITRFTSLIQYGPDEMPLLKARHEVLLAQRERDQYASRIAKAKEYLNGWDLEDWSGMEEMMSILDGRDKS